MDIGVENQYCPISEPIYRKNLQPNVNTEVITQKNNFSTADRDIISVSLHLFYSGEKHKILSFRIIDSH